MAVNPSRPKIMQPCARIKIIKPPLKSAQAQTKEIEKPEDELSWTDKPTNMLDIPFKGNSQLKVQLKGQKPSDYLDILIDNNYLDMVANETNSVAHKSLKELNKTKFQLPEWKPVTRDEIKIFFGLLLHMGIIKLPQLSDYWSGDNLFRIPIFPRTMSRSRFLLLLRFLRFTKDNATAKGDDVKNVQKVEGIVEYFQTRMKKLYSPGKQIVIDGPMIFHKGRLVFERCVPGSKYRSVAFRLYTLRDSSSGVILKIYISMDPVYESGIRRVHQNEKIVTNMLEGFIGKGHSVYMSGSYNSLDLSQKLLTKFTYSTGPFKPEKAQIPSESELNRKLTNGESAASYTTSGLCITKYKGRGNEVLFMVSSEQSHVIVNTANGKDPARPLPKVLALYDLYTTKFDFSDDFLSHYPCENYPMNLYSKLGILIIQLAVLNSYYLFNKYSDKKMDLYEFRQSVVKALIPAAGSAPASPTRTFVHFPKKTAPIRGDDGTGAATGPIRRVKEQCKHCLSIGKKKTTIYYCPYCTGKPPLCLDPCFKLYHTM